LSDSKSWRKIFSSTHHKRFLILLSRSICSSWCQSLKWPSAISWMAWEELTERADKCSFHNFLLRRWSGWLIRRRFDEEKKSNMSWWYAGWTANVSRSSFCSCAAAVIDIWCSSLSTFKMSLHIWYKARTETFQLRIFMWTIHEGEASVPEGACWDKRKDASLTQEKMKDSGEEWKERLWERVEKAEKSSRGSYGDRFSNMI